MANFPIGMVGGSPGQSPAVAGWLGAISILTEGGPVGLRFTDESVIIDQGLAVADDVHAGVRVPTIFEYRFIVPTGTISFPLVAESTHRLAPGGLTIEAGVKALMKYAIQPYEDNGTYPPTPSPCLGSEMTMYRGDCNKVVSNPWAESITVSGSAGQRVNVSLDIKGTYGFYEPPTTSNLAFPNARAVFFNELNWDKDNFTASLVQLTTAGDVSFSPRNFTFTCNNNLQNDESYNDEAPQSLRGFFYGQQNITAELTIVGGADAHRGGTEVGTDSPLLSDLGSPYFNMADLYNIHDGLWERKVINIPGMTDIAVSTLTFRGMSSGAGSVFCATPGAALA